MEEGNLFDRTVFQGAFEGVFVMLPQEILEACCKPFGLKAGQLRHLARSQNDVYETIDEGERGRLIVRISSRRERSACQIEAELDWIDHLAELRLPVCRAQHSLAGRRCETIEWDGHEYHTVVFRRSPGRMIEEADVNQTLYERIGKLVAHLHTDSFDRPFWGPPSLARSQWYQSRLLTSDVEQYLSVEDALFRDVLRDRITTLQPQVDDQLGLIHADLSFSNLAWEKERLWVFDFDNCEFGTVAQDLATFLYDSIYCDLLNRAPRSELNERIQERWDSFLTGYQSIRPELILDHSLLEDFIILREATIYIHYCRILKGKTISEKWREGMREMRTNIEQWQPAFNLFR